MKVTGHRGAKGLAPENTIAGFRKALEHNVDEIELDVRISSDGKPVLSHDPHITDQSGARLSITATPLVELKQHKSDLTTLEEALDYINCRCPVIIEVKPGEPTGPIIAIIRRYLKSGEYSEKDLLVSSYSQHVLLQLHEALPGLQTIVIEDWSGVRATRRARELGTKRISMLEIWLWGGFIKAMNRSGYQLYSFPNKTPRKERFFARLGLGNASNNPAKALRWAKSGLAGVITDYPDRFEKK